MAYFFVYLSDEVYDISGKLFKAVAQNLQTITGTINVDVFFFFFFQFNQILCEPAEPLAVIVTVTNYDNSLVSLIISGQICDV